MSHYRKQKKTYLTEPCSSRVLSLLRPDKGGGGGGGCGQPGH